jgi:hypothetical protein
MKLKKDYYVPGSHHVCMFCETPVAALRDGVLRPLGNKAHVLLEKEPEGLYVINCCGDCAKQVDFTSKDNLSAIHKNVLALMPLDQRAELKKHRPVVGFKRIELSVSDRAKHVRDYQEMRKKHASKL